MARISPTPGLKITYFLFIFLASIILYFDITTDSFRDFKNGFKSSKIYGSYILRNISIEPAKKILTITKSKNKLLEENKILKDALNLSYLNNFIISNENSFYKDNELIKNFSKNNEDKYSYDIAKLKSLDPKMFECCDNHRIFIELITNNIENLDESMVFNSDGVIGQIINNNKYYEVILLTDTKHSTPVKILDEDFYCNARGSGKADIIICEYNPLVWSKDIELGTVFYSSGFGGVYPKDIVIGNLIKKVDIEPSKINLEIRLIANPTKNNLFGVIKY